MTIHPHSYFYKNEDGSSSPKTYEGIPSYIPVGRDAETGKLFDYCFIRIYPNSGYSSFSKDVSGATNNFSYVYGTGVKNGVSLRDPVGEVVCSFVGYK